MAINLSARNGQQRRRRRNLRKQKNQRNQRRQNGAEPKSMLNKKHLEYGDGYL